MHLCSVCGNTCTCSGDVTADFVALHEPSNCLCCIGVCDHGIPAEDFCSACAADEAVIETPATCPQLNGGW